MEEKEGDGEGRLVDQEREKREEKREKRETAAHTHL